MKVYVYISDFKDDNCGQSRHVSVFSSLDEARKEMRKEIEYENDREDGYFTGHILDENRDIVDEYTDEDTGEVDYGCGIEHFDDSFQIWNYSASLDISIAEREILE